MGDGLADGVDDPPAVAVALGAAVPLGDADPLGGVVVDPEGCTEAGAVALAESVGITGGDD